MGGDSSYMSMLRIAGFLAAAWMATKISRLIGVSSIVMEITTGVVLGPQILGLIPHQYAECEAKKYVMCEAPGGFDDGYGVLSEALEHTAHEGYCDKAAYVAKANEGKHPGTMNINFTATGVMYRYLAADHVLMTHFEEAISMELASRYVPVTRSMAGDAHGDGHSDGHHRRLEVPSEDHDNSSHNDSTHDAHSEGGSDHHDEHMGHEVDHGEHVEEGVLVHVHDHEGSVMVEVEIGSGDAGYTETMIAQDAQAGTLQERLKAVIMGLDYIGSAADVHSIDIFNVQASWTLELFSPMFNQSAPMPIVTEAYRFITCTGSNQSLYWQGNMTRHYVDQLDERMEYDHSYLHNCMTNAVELSMEDMLAIPVGVKWWGCGMQTAGVQSHSRRLVEGPETVAADARPLDAPSRRLAGGAGGGAKYESYGTCLIKECEAHMSSDCQKYPDVMTLIGHTGVAMMIFESGMHFDFGMARQVGPWACVVAVLGTFLPLVTGVLVAWIYGNPISPDGLTAGTSLAPTSVGISLRLLGEAGVLNLDFGQTIMTAAFVDDILSLILFNVIFAAAKGEISFATFQGSIIGVAFMLFAIGLAVCFWPCALKNYLLPGAEAIKRKLAPVDPEDPPKISEKDEAMFAIMLLMLLGYATITFFCGTHLWGCFIAGMSFACLDEEPGHAHHVWVKQTKRITSWMIRIFFACTVAFSIPVAELLNLEAFWKGSIMGIGPCILTKVSCAFFMGPPKFVIGWAMVGRAEFAYLIAQMGLAGGLVDDKLFSQLIWALLWATIFAPLIFKFVLNRFIRDQGIEVTSPKAPKKDNSHEDNRHLVGDEEAQRGGTALENVVQEYQAKQLDASPNMKGFDANEPKDDKPWEEAALGVASNKPAEELPPIPTLGKRAAADPGQGGRGFLCCIFFKKVTMV